MKGMGFHNRGFLLASIALGSLANLGNVAVGLTRGIASQIPPIHRDQILRRGAGKLRSKNPPSHKTRHNGAHRFRMRAKARAKRKALR